MQPYLLSLLLFTPLLAALVSLLLPDGAHRGFRMVAWACHGVQALLLATMLIQYQPDQGLQFTEQAAWITLDMGTWGTLKATYFVGLDGLSLPLVALTVFVMAIATAASAKIKENVKGYFVLMLVLNTAIIGSFAALDFLLFYLFFEFMLLPMFFLIALWGGPRRDYASIKFFLYTLLGSIFILIAMIALYVSVHDPSTSGSLVHSFNMLHMADATNFISQSILDPNNPRIIGGLPARTWAFILLVVGFAIKLPAVPLHTWLPDAHVEAPTPVSVVLAALLLKIGGYGLLRIAFPVFPEAAYTLGWLVGGAGVLSVIYGALNAMSSKDLKRLIAYSSVSHMGFVLLGIASLTAEGVAGAVYLMVAHGLISAMLFLLAGVLQDRTNDRLIAHYSGLATTMKGYTTFVVIAFFASLGLPGFAGFIGEIMIFLGAFKSASLGGPLHEGLAIVATLGLVLGAAYYLWTLQRMFFGPLHLKAHLQVSQLTALSARERAMLVPLACAVIFFGIFPQSLMVVIDPFARHFSTFVLGAGKTLLLTP